MAKKTAKRAPVKKAAKKAPVKKAAKKAAGGGRAKTTNRREAILRFDGTKSKTASRNQMRAQEAALKRGRRTAKAAVAVAGVTKTAAGATLARRQTRKNLDVAGTRFFDRDGNRVEGNRAFTKAGSLRAGFQAERAISGGRRGVVVGGGQNG